MIRWDNRKNDKVESAKADQFIAAILALCKAHGISISHQDHHGAFELEAYDPDFDNWLRECHLGDSFPQEQ